MERSAALHDALEPALPDQAPYAAALAYRVRYMMHMNAREAMHVLELRTSPQGHPAYRRVCQEMHTLIRDVAGHRAIAEMMSYVDHSSGSDLERLDSERRSEQKRVMTMDGSDSSIT
jgi:thymidylate synthase ThyX